MNILDELRYLTGLGISDLTRIISSAPVRYKVYSIPKKSGGSRTIAQPSRELKFLQRNLAKLILEKCPVHPSATAYEPGSRIFSNAQSHAQNYVILKMDFESFFHSIKPTAWRNFAKSKLDLSAADISLTEKIFFWGAGTNVPACLSIGAPTSPQLSNILMYDFDVEISRICKDMGVVYTRYADDITISGRSKEILQSVEKRIVQVVSKTKYPSLRFNQEKRGIYTKSQRRVVSGLKITPTGDVSLGRERKRFISSLVHKYSLNILDDEARYKLKGLLAFAADNEPAFLTRLRAKYGDDIIDQVIRMHIPKRGLRQHD
ncbi:retron St85 family RNA-directed DNA polymerase [Rhizobium leguminosarum]|uniref:retron St85 family RNA-directed DNA polymerase n=1 Tax=Rhizobium leguminosarum TaxID=384 RepID=UPI003F980954